MTCIWATNTWLRWRSYKFISEEIEAAEAENPDYEVFYTENYLSSKEKFLYKGFSRTKKQF